MAGKQEVLKVRESQKNIKNLGLSIEEKSNLAVIIGRVFDLQKQYGKTTSQLETIVSGFCWVLEDYPFDIIVEGFKKYIKYNPTMPTPADIIAIIDPAPIPWAPDKQYYGRLKKLREEGGPYALDKEEADYMSAYEEYMKKGFRDDY